MVEADFLQVRDQIPVDLQLHGVLERLLDGGAFATHERMVERSAGAFAFEDGGERVLVAVEDAEAGIGGLGRSEPSPPLCEALPGRPVADAGDVGGVMGS